MKSKIMRAGIAVMTLLALGAVAGAGSKWI